MRLVLELGGLLKERYTRAAGKDAVTVANWRGRFRKARIRQAGNELTSKGRMCNHILLDCKDLRVFLLNKQRTEVKWAVARALRAFGAEVTSASIAECRVTWNRFKNCRGACEDRLIHGPLWNPAAIGHDPFVWTVMEDTKSLGRSLLGFALHRSSAVSPGGIFTPL